MIKTLYPPFRKWTEKGTLWIYSDPHFSDPDMVKLRRNYISDEGQIKRINSKVGKHDTIIFLGDIGNEEMVRKVRGYKVLIMGNHDKGASNYVDIFDEVYEGPLFIAEKLVLSHEPIDLPFAFNIHGHEHCYNWREHRLNVCAEHIGYYPLNMNKMLKSGLLSEVDSIHRMTIDRAVERKQNARHDFKRELDTILVSKICTDDEIQEFISQWKIVDVKAKAVCQISIESDEAFRILCKTLHMDAVLDDERDFFVKKGPLGDNCVYYVIDGHDKLYDDRGDLFVALRNVAVSMFPNLSFRGADYIYNTEV